MCPQEHEHGHTEQIHLAAYSLDNHGSTLQNTDAKGLFVHPTTSQISPQNLRYTHYREIYPIKSTNELQDSNKK